MAYYPEPVARLIEALQRLPGIGPKTAQRLTFFLLKRPADEVRELSAALVAVKERIVSCQTLLQRHRRRPLPPLRRTPGATTACSAWWRSPTTSWPWSARASFAGATTCSSGALSPLDGIGPDDIKVRELLARLDAGGVTEVILATNPNVEGEATALYLAKLLRPLGLRVTRIARGLPVGGDLEYADQVTLSKALEGRREIV